MTAQRQVPGPVRSMRNTAENGRLAAGGSAAASPDQRRPVGPRRRSANPPANAPTPMSPRPMADRPPLACVEVVPSPVWALPFGATEVTVRWAVVELPSEQSMAGV